MVNQFIITIDNKVTNSFALDFFKYISFIKSIKPKTQIETKDTQIDEVTLISERSLSEEWLSDEDNRWDLVL